MYYINGFSKIKFFGKIVEKRGATIGVIFDDMKDVGVLWFLPDDITPVANTTNIR